MRDLLLATLVSVVLTQGTTLHAQTLPRWPPEQWTWGAFLGIHDFADDSGLGREGMVIPGTSLENGIRVTLAGPPHPDN